MATTVTSNAQIERTARPWQIWTGRVLSTLPILMLLMSASIKLMHAPQFVTTWTDKLGWQESSLTNIGILELACVIVYAVPRTAFAGALVLTAYLGGAVATHVRIGEPFFVPVVLGILIWAGLYLRDERLRALVLRRS